jgi:uncharacterized protein (TIGR02231 family)
MGDEREAVQGRIAALEGKRGAIEVYAQASPQRMGDETRPMPVDQWAAAWEAIGQGLAGVNEDLRQARARLKDLEAEIAALERARPRPVRPGEPRQDVAIAVEAAAPLKAGLRVTYRVAGAAWIPAYDARLSLGAKPALELARRAQVRQRTGEDWSDVELSVSTVRTAAGTAAPELGPLQVEFARPRVVRPAPRGREPGEESMPAPMAAAPAHTVRAREVEATLDAEPYSATFRVPGRVGVAGDGVSKTLLLGRRSITPALLARVVPVLDETAYLEATFTHDEEAPLLPGEVAITREGTYVGRGAIELAAPGETVTLGFGADDRIKATRVPLARRETEPGWASSARTDQREFKTTVRNLHPTPMRVTLLDRLPFSEDAAIAVELLRDATPPTQRGVEDRRGVVAWTHDYAPGETREIRFGYRLRWPADRELAFEPRP